MTDATTPPAGQDATPAPLSQPWLLAIGRRVTFVMPDLLALASGDLDIPNESQAAIFELIYGDDIASLDPVKVLQGNRDRLRGLYELFAIVCPEARLVLDDDDRKPGDMHPRQLSWQDLTGAYTFFRLGPSVFLQAAAAPQPAAAVGSAPAGDDVPPRAE